MSEYLLYLVIGTGAGVLLGAMTRVRAAIASGLADGSLD